MIALATFTTLVTLAFDTWQRIAARRQARETMTNAEKYAAAIEQTNKNTAIWQQIQSEAKAQIAAHDEAIETNLNSLEKMVDELKAAARQ